MSIKEFILNNNFWGLLIHKTVYPRDNKLIKDNLKYKNIHIGKRCFILGNGPSLKTENLSLLRNEYVFTVNQFTRNSQAINIKPNFHVWADANFFAKGYDTSAMEELNDVMKTIINCNPNVEVFYPLNQQEFVEYHHFNEIMSVNYFCSRLDFKKTLHQDIDLTHFIPGFGTVVQYAMAIAVYMGFKEIYLLGCDNTGLLVTIKSALKQNDDSDYAYHMTINEKKRMEQLIEKNSLEAYVKAFLETIECYRLWSRYCSDRDIKLVNCSSTTVIDSIERMSLCEVLKQQPIIVS